MELAIEEFSAAIALDPEYAEAFSARGFVYCSISDYDQAIVDIEKALELGLDSVLQEAMEALLVEIKDSSSCSLPKPTPLQTNSVAQIWYPDCAENDFGAYIWDKADNELNGARVLGTLPHGTEVVILDSYEWFGILFYEIEGGLRGWIDFDGIREQ